MRKLLFLSVTAGLLVGANAQVEVRNLESVPTQRQSSIEKLDASFATKFERGIGDNTPSKPKRKSNVTYTYFRQVSNVDFAYYPSSGNLFNASQSIGLFPDSMAFRYQRDVSDFANNGKLPQCASTGFVFDPYSTSFDTLAVEGLFLEYDGTDSAYYGYRLDTLWTLVDYRMPKGYNPASPDTLRFYFTYYHAYRDHSDSANFMKIRFINTPPDPDDHAICPKVEYPNPIPQKGVGPLMKAPKLTIDYVLTDKDTSVIDQGSGLIHRATIAVPILDGFAVPPGACLGVVAQYLPGYDYNLNDTLLVITFDNGQYVNQEVKENILSIAAWDFDATNQDFLFDSEGFNTFFLEDNVIRYKKPVTANEQTIVGWSIYNPLYSDSPAFWMSLAKSDDTSIYGYDPCDYYYTPVSIEGSIQGSDFVLRTTDSYASYLWSTSEASPTIQATSETKYWVTVTDNDGCISSDTTTVIFVIDTICDNTQYNFHGQTLTATGVYAATVPPNTYKLDLTSIPSPPPPIITRTGSIFTSSSADNNQWYLEDSILAGATGQTHDWTQTGTGRYSVVVTTPNGCFSKADKGIYSVRGRVKNNANGTGIEGIAIKHLVDSIVLTDISGNYVFYLDGGATTTIEPDTTNYTYSPASWRINAPGANTNYTNRDFQATAKGTGIVDIKAGSVHIYPNPASTKLHIDLPTQATADYTIYNIMGQVIQQGNLQGSSVIHIEPLACGMYYLKITGKENTTIKFVKQ